MATRNLTKLANLINPEVMADMVSAALPAAIKFAPLAKIDTTLEGRPGNTITVPKFAYIGDAEDVAEGVEMGTTVLTASTTNATVKKAGKAVELSDEAVLSGLGNPTGEAVGQLTKSIAAKVDNDCLNALGDAPLTYDGAANDESIGYDGVVKALDLFEDENDGTETVIFVHPNQITELRQDENFLDKSKYGNETIMNGEVGMIAGARVVKSKKVSYNTETQTYLNPIVIVDERDPLPGERQGEEGDTGVEGAESAPALTIYIKREAQVETAREILSGKTIVAANQHYVAVLSNDSKVVAAFFKKKA